MTSSSHCRLQLASTCCILCNMLCLPARCLLLYRLWLPSPEADSKPGTEAMQCSLACCRLHAHCFQAPLYHLAYIDTSVVTACLTLNFNRDPSSAITTCVIGLNLMRILRLACQLPWLQRGTPPTDRPNSRTFTRQHLNLPGLQAQPRPAGLPSHSSQSLPGHHTAVDCLYRFCLN